MVLHQHRQDRSIDVFSAGGSRMAKGISQDAPKMELKCHWNSSQLASEFENGAAHSFELQCSNVHTLPSLRSLRHNHAYHFAIYLDLTCMMRSYAQLCDVA
jgi:hypothetical protein